MPTRKEALEALDRLRGRIKSRENRYGDLTILDKGEEEIKTIRTALMDDGWRDVTTLKSASNRQKKKFDVWVEWDTGKQERVTDCYWHNKANAIMGINSVRQTALYWQPLPPPPKGKNHE